MLISLNYLANGILDFETQFTSPNFAINYFGYGNKTVNNDEVFGMDYNRVQIQILKVSPSIKKIGRLWKRNSVSNHL